MVRKQKKRRAYLTFNQSNNVKVNKMTKEDFKKLDSALALLHDLISNHGAKAADYAILEAAENVLGCYLGNYIKED